MNLLGEAQDVAAQIAPDLNKMDAFRQGAALRALAELALKQGDLDRARDLAQRSATLGINPNAHANTLLIQAQVFAARHNTHRALTLCRDILETRSVRFYKQRAQELIDRLEAPDTLANSPAQKYVTAEEEERKRRLQRGLPIPNGRNRLRRPGRASQRGRPASRAVCPGTCAAASWPASHAW